MSAIQVTRSETILASPEEVFAVLRNLEDWRPWSPWLIAEADAKVTYRDDGKAYAWDGKYIGSGEMEIESVEENRSIVAELRFLKPFKSKAKTRFDIVRDGAGCVVSWTMNSSMPLYMFFLKKLMTNMIGMDYSRGLSMLKEYVETGSVASQISYQKTNSNSLHLIGVRDHCDMADIGTAMEAAAAKLHDACDGPKGKGISIYHKWDLNRGRAVFTFGCLVDELPKDVPADCEAVTIPATPVFEVTHTGGYEYLGNAWATGMCRSSRSRGFKSNKKIAPFEIYDNAPGEVPSGQLVTRVHFPMKSE